MNAAAFAERTSVAPHPLEARLARIELRRFAGPSSYVGELDHLRIAHLTDLHVGRVTPIRVHRAAAALANAQNPDLVVITGDFVCHSTRYLDELSDVIRSFGVPVVCTMGNHDYWSGADEVRWALRRGGAEVLDNANTVLTLRGQKLQIVGLDDAYTGHANREKAVKGLRNDLPTLGLSHIAEEADWLWRHGVPFVLSGHTHAGQVTVAKLHEIAIGKIAGHKYVHGMYGNRREQGAVYVGAGIGAAVMPIRLGDRGRREVTIFDLGHQPGTFDEHHDDQPALPGRKPSAAKQAKRAAAVVAKAEKRQSRITLAPPRK
jgi:predicted MPP superfamily phosphohydrolase